MKSSHAVILSVGLILAAMIFGMFFYAARSSDQTIDVVGAATRQFESDILKWRLTINRRTGMSGLADGYSRMRDDVRALYAVITELGIDSSEINVQPVNSYPDYDRDGRPSGYNLTQVATVISSDIEPLEKLALDPGELLERGVVLQNSNLEYFYSKLSEIKLQLLAEATRDARERARQIAESSDVSLGEVTALRAGVFQIREPFSTDVSSYGVYNTQSQTKDITVTVRASFTVD